MIQDGVINATKTTIYYCRELCPSLTHFFNDKYFFNCCHFLSLVLCNNLCQEHEFLSVFWQLHRLLSQRVSSLRSVIKAEKSFRCKRKNKSQKFSLLHSVKLVFSVSKMKQNLAFVSIMICILFGGKKFVFGAKTVFSSHKGRFDGRFAVLSEDKSCFGDFINFVSSFFSCSEHISKSVIEDRVVDKEAISSTVNNKEYCNNDVQFEASNNHFLIKNGELIDVDKHLKNVKQTLATATKEVNDILSLLAKYKKSQVVYNHFSGFLDVIKHNLDFVTKNDVIRDNSESKINVSTNLKLCFDKTFFPKFRFE